jgi:mono/diheme cytochrome c family protein
MNNVPNNAQRRLPLVANDIGFVGATGEAYVPANGADAVFRVAFDAATGGVTAVGAGATRPFIDLGAMPLTPEQKGQNPIGVAVARSKGFAFVANDISRNVSVVDLAMDKQIVAGSDGNDARVIATAAPPADPTSQAINRGKRLFNTGLGRWSLAGQAWVACQSCHLDGLSDNVTWYFARGPRQSTSLEGSFATKDPNDQRIFNWTAIQDETSDLENTARGLQGGVGAIVSNDSDPPVGADRINLADTMKYPPAGAVALNGSSQAIVTAESARQDWDDFRAYAQSIRSPRAPKGLDAALVTAGEALYKDLATGGKCQGCHGGAKWTISQRFYNPGGAVNEALLTTVYDGAALVAAGFPAALLPATAGNQFMRSPNPKNGGLDSIQCLLRPVGTFAVSPMDVNVIEVRQDMLAKGQGDEPNGKGFNVPSILGMQVGAPFMHAGNARTLEELFGAIFSGHHAALTQNATYLGKPEEIDQLVAFVLSIDEDKAIIAAPAAPGADGGNFCAPPP